jgi:hypothetical protein
MRKLLPLLLLILIASCSSEENKSSFVPETNMAQEYIVIKNFEYATPPDKKGLEVTIFSKKSTTFEKRAHTVIKAASSILKEKGLYEIIVRMSASPDINKYNLMAYVQYNPYKKNTWGTDEKYIWSVKASNNEISNGKLIEDGKSYPISYISVKKYLQK